MFVQHHQPQDERTRARAEIALPRRYGPVWVGTVEESGFSSQSLSTPYLRTLLCRVDPPLAPPHDPSLKEHISACGLIPPEGLLGVRDR